MLLRRLKHSKCIVCGASTGGNLLVCSQKCLDTHPMTPEIARKIMEHYSRIHEDEVIDGATLG